MTRTWSEKISEKFGFNLGRELLERGNHSQEIFKKRKKKVAP